MRSGHSTIISAHRVHASLSQVASFRGSIQARSGGSAQREPPLLARANLAAQIDGLSPPTTDSGSPAILASFVFVVIGALSAVNSEGTNEDDLLAGSTIAPWLVTPSAVATNCRV